MKYLKLFPLIAFLLSACASTGVQFNKISDIPSDKGIIYLYRSITIPLGWNLVRYAVFDGNEEQMCDLIIPNGYCQIYALPGDIQLSAQLAGKESITINIKPGHEYFVRADVFGFNPSYKPLFTLVDNKVGLEEISNNRLLQTSETEWTVGTEMVQPIHESIEFPTSNVPVDKSVACFYRDWKMLSAMNDFRISEKNQEVGILKNESYFCKLTNPGKHIYAISVNRPGFFRSTKVNLKPGLTHYFRFNVVDYSFNPVEEMEGLKIITNMKR